MSMKPGFFYSNASRTTRITANLAASSSLCYLTASWRAMIDLFGRPYFVSIKFQRFVCVAKNVSGREL